MKEDKLGVMKAIGENMRKVGDLRKVKEYWMKEGLQERMNGKGDLSGLVMENEMNIELGKLELDI